MVTFPLVPLPPHILVGHFSSSADVELITKCAVDFDTGSAALFLPGPSCPNCDGHDIYNPTQSSTSKDLGTNSTLDYGRGEVKGEIYMDNVFAGGFKVSRCWLPVGALN